jgi:hypothetical protein
MNRYSSDTDEELIDQAEEFVSFTRRAHPKLGLRCGLCVQRWPCDEILTADMVEELVNRHKRVAAE